MKEGRKEGRKDGRKEGRKEAGTGRCERFERVVRVEDGKI
jgi:hypothetical protein